VQDLVVGGNRGGVGRLDGACSTSAWVTSLSRTTAMPVESLLLMWLPAMPVYTSRTLQPAIISTSAMAREIEFTVASMLITMPRLRPVDSCEPMPEHAQPPLGIQFADDGDDLGGADVEADDQVAFGFLAHELS
jgi:hypothetical protein